MYVCIYPGVEMGRGKEEGEGEGEGVAGARKP